MCAQLNSPLGPFRNNKQSVTSNTRLHYQLNYQLELIKTGGWNEFGCNPASFFCCVPGHSCEWAPFCAAACQCELRGHKKTVSAFHGEPSLFSWKKQLEGPGISIMGTQMEPPLCSEVPVTSGLYLSGTMPEMGRWKISKKKKKTTKDGQFFSNTGILIKW